MSCGEIVQQVQQVQKAQQVGPIMPGIPTYLAHAILVTIFCCVPFGIVGIVYAAQVNGKVMAGDYAGAVDASNKARTWCWVSFGIGLAAGLIWFFIGLTGALSGV